MALLETGQEPSIAALGGLEAIASAVRRLSASPLMPDVLRPVLRFWAQAPAQDRTLVVNIVRNLLEGASTDFVLIEAVDIRTFHPLPDGADRTMFRYFPCQGWPERGGACRAGPWRGAGWSLSLGRVEPAMAVAAAGFSFGTVTE